MPKWTKIYHFVGMKISSYCIRESTPRMLHRPSKETNVMTLQGQGINHMQEKSRWQVYNTFNNPDIYTLYRYLIDILIQLFLPLTHSAGNITNIFVSEEQVKRKILQILGRFPSLIVFLCLLESLTQKNTQKRNKSIK